MAKITKKNLTFQNILSYLEAHTKILKDRFIGLPEHTKEQIAYRHSLCEDCIEQDACVYCSCDPKAKAFATESCNKGERFPNLMEKEEWEQFKKSI